MKVELSREAEEQVGTIDAWWRQNRPAAPDVFLAELHVRDAQTCVQPIRDQPEDGTAGRTVDARPVVASLLASRFGRERSIVERLKVELSRASRDGSSTGTRARPSSSGTTARRPSPAIHLVTAPRHDLNVVAMSAHSATSASNSASASRFYSARLASILAVCPLGVWTFFHLWNNLAVYQGADAWQKAVTVYPHPVAQLLTGILVLVPLALHTVWGISRIYSSQPNNGKYTYFGNWKYLLQRLSAVGVLFFIGAHLWLAFLHPRLVEGHAEVFSEISHEMHFHGPTLVVYILGTLGVAYHLANGLQLVTMGWGLVSSRRALRQLEWVTILVFLLLLAMSWGAIYGLYSATASTTA